VAGGYRLAHDAGLLWSAFERLHHSHGLPEPLEIPMESFTRAVEIVLKDSEVRDDADYRPAAPGAKLSLAPGNLTLPKDPHRAIVWTQHGTTTKQRP